MNPATFKPLKEAQEAFREAAFGASDPYEAEMHAAMAAMEAEGTPPDAGGGDAAAPAAKALPAGQRAAPRPRFQSMGTVGRAPAQSDVGPPVTAGDIASALSMRKAGTGYTGACPNCGYRGFTVEDRQGKTLVRCHAGGCAQADVIGALRKQGLWRGTGEGGVAQRRERIPRPAAVEKAGSDERTEWARRLWGTTKPGAGTPVETYLRMRGYLGPVPPALRFHPALKHKDGPQRHPGMVAAVMIGDSLAAVHRTYLRPDGRGKAGLSDDKLSLGPIGGGAVYLHIGPLPRGGRLAVSEGIETGLAVMQATGIPTWAALSAGGIRKLILPPLDIAPEIIIAADHDRAGLDAAHAAARRWHSEGRRVRIAVPPTEGKDFADMIGGAP